MTAHQILVSRPLLSNPELAAVGLLLAARYGAKAGCRRDRKASVAAVSRRIRVWERNSSPVESLEAGAQRAPSLVHLNTPTARKRKEL
jgi:hypothetical protein